MAGQSPLRRWKPFFAAFDLVDAAIEAADPALCRDEFRSTRGAVVEQLCGVPAGAAGEAEKLCLVLDDFMAESLVSLRKVPACAVRRVLESSADLTKAVCALRWSHQSERVCGLADDVIHRWSVAVEDDIAKDAAKLDAACRVEAAEASKMEATKRKLREGYREAEDAKR
jgi:hypothetical protein